MVKPFNKCKNKTVDPQPLKLPLDDPPEEANASNDTKKEGDCFGRIEEFNADIWGLATKGWIAGALKKGFDSMAIMQPLLDMVQVSAQGSSKRSHPRPNIGLSTESHCKIAEGVVSDSK